MHMPCTCTQLHAHAMHMHNIIHVMLLVTVHTYMCMSPSAYSEAQGSPSTAHMHRYNVPGPDVPYRTHLPRALAPQVSLPPPTSSGEADYPGLADTLAARRQAHPGATVRLSACSWATGPRRCVPSRRTVGSSLQSSISRGGHMPSSRGRRSIRGRRNIQGTKMSGGCGRGDPGGRTVAAALVGPSGPSSSASSRRPRRRP
jgi:hypothetical protein